ncbi:ABC transporter permease [Bhargavaea ginsengi]|uniref:ABC transporter permease n=1 Tax=Bhargavaea ginsengi TaxID=426757 RepID=UPI003C783963
MNIRESFALALSSIWNHKIRSILTMLGIIIGVSAVIIVVAIGDGARQQMADDLFSTDENAIPLYFEQTTYEENGEMMWVEPPAVTGEQLDAVKEVAGVKYVLGTNSGWGTMNHNEHTADMEIIGVDNQYFIAKDLTLLEGRRLNTRDNDSYSRVAMIDSLTRENMFAPDEEAVGAIIDINDNPYKVVGVYESTLPPEFRHMDEFMNGQMLMPRTLISMMFGSPEIDTINVIADQPDNLTETGFAAAEKLTELTGSEEGMYVAEDMSAYVEEFDSFYMTITLFISSIAGISLLVGGIGVMNIMLVSVTERTREIGLRKALGATRGQILRQFLIESVTLTSLGGLIGIGFAALVTAVAAMFLPFTPIINPVVVIVGILFSSMIGIVFGILPANKASKLSPIDALRYE